MLENEKDSEDEFLLSFKKKILFKKYKVIKKLCSGAFSNIYLGISILNGSKVAIKLEKRNIPNPHLETEAYFLYYLKGVGIPEILTFGRTKNYNILIEPLLGKSLYHLFVENNYSFNIKDICLFGIQLIDRLEWIHSKNVIHRDIKPDNCIIGDKGSNILYLIDFGLSAKFRSSSSGKHIKFGFTGKLTGTTKYSSVNSFRGCEQSRKDDLESMVYMIIFFLKGRLPWEDIESEDELNKFNKIYLLKKNITIEKLCEGLPEEIHKLLKYVKQLKFEEKPDYNYMKLLFKNLLLRFNYVYNDKINFSWANSNLLIDKFSKNNNKNKSNFHNRLFKNILKNLEYKRSFNNNFNKSNEIKNLISYKSNRISENDSLIKEKNNKTYKNIINSKKRVYLIKNKNKNVGNNLEYKQKINNLYNSLSFSKDYSKKINNNILTISSDYGFKIPNNINNLNNSLNNNYNINNNNIFMKMKNKNLINNIPKNKKFIKIIPIPNHKNNKLNLINKIKDAKNVMIKKKDNNYRSILNINSQTKNQNIYINFPENNKNIYKKLNTSTNLTKKKSRNIKSTSNLNDIDKEKENKIKNYFDNPPLFQNNLYVDKLDLNINNSNNNIYLTFPGINNTSLDNHQMRKIKKSFNKNINEQNFNELFYTNTIDNFNMN